MMDFTVTIGNLVTVVTSLGSLFWVFTRLAVRLSKLEATLKLKVDMMWKDFCKRHEIGREDEETDN